MQKIVMVDIDSTLWDFIGELVLRMRTRFPYKNVPDKFETWECPINFFNNKHEAYSIFNDIHMNQSEFGIYPYAKELLDSLKENYIVHIASNRIPKSKCETEKWLKKHDIFYDDLFCSLDKRELFHQFNYKLVIDDAPHVQQAALQKNIPVITLETNYNKHIAGTIKFNCLNDMKKFIEN